MKTELFVLSLNYYYLLQTHYEHQWLDRGLTIKYLRWELSHCDNLIEPEIDIEKDTYRSYGRNYNTSDSTNKSKN